MGTTHSHPDIDSLKKENDKYKQESLVLIDMTASAAEKALVSANNLAASLKSEAKNKSVNEKLSLCSLMIRDGDSLMASLNKMNHTWETASQHIVEWLSVASKYEDKLKDKEWLSFLSLNPIAIATIIATTESEIKAIKESEKRAKQLGAKMSATSTNFQRLYNDISDAIAAARNAVDNGGSTAFGRLPTFLPSVETEVSDLEKLLADIRTTRNALK